MMSAEDGKIEGRSVDMWGFGVMVLQIFTYFGLTKAAKGSSEDTYAIILNLIEEKSFVCSVLEVYNTDDLSEAQARVVHRFIQEILVFEAYKRLSAKGALAHEFLRQANGWFPTTTDAKCVGAEKDLILEKPNVDEDRDKIMVMNQTLPKSDIAENGGELVKISKVNDSHLDGVVEMESCPQIEMTLNDIEKPESGIIDKGGELVQVRDTVDEPVKVKSKTGDDQMMKMEEKINLILLKVTELTTEVKDLRTKVDATNTTKELFKKISHEVSDVRIRAEPVTMDYNEMNEDNPLLDNCIGTKCDDTQDESLAAGNGEQIVSKEKDKKNTKKRSSLAWIRKKFLAFGNFIRSAKKERPN